MLSGIDIEVLLAGAYAIFLIIVAFSLELVARHTHRQAERSRLVGFKYDPQRDIWECPTGQKLTRIAFDHDRKLSRYRAPAAVCNACSLKQLCTGSDRGREIEHSPVSWLQSELARFHRGISLSLAMLAELLLIAEMIRHQRATEWLFLASILLPLTFFGTQLASAFFSCRPGLRSDTER
jgi:hypothetical protein